MNMTKEQLQKRIERLELRCGRLEQIIEKGMHSPIAGIWVGYEEHDAGTVSEPQIAFLTEEEAKNWAKLIGSYTYKFVPVGEKNV